MNVMKHIETAAIKKAHQKGWIPFRFEYTSGEKDTAILVYGGVPVGVYQNGGNRGRPRWDKRNSQMVVVRPSDIEQASEEYERASGNCSGCLGETRVQVGWTKEVCPICGGTGRVS